MSAARERDPERTRAAVLDAAEALFATRGYAGTSLHEIGEAAGVSRGTPTYFYRSKDRLYAAVLERMVAHVGDVLTAAYERAAEESSSRDTVLEAVLDAYLEFLARESTFVRLVQREVLDERAVLAGVAARALPRVPAVTFLSEELARHGVALDAPALLLDLATLAWSPFVYSGDGQATAAARRQLLQLVLARVRGASDADV